MSATVGGQLEEVQRPRSLFGPDYLRLAALALVAVAVHGWLIAHTAITARDSLGFARTALCFASPAAAPPHADGRPKNVLDHVRESQHPPGYALAVCATDAALRRALPGMPVVDRVLLATQLASAAAAVLLVLPTYLLGRMLFSRNVGFAAALLLQVLPVTARLTSDGVNEGTYLLATSVALALGVRAVRVPRISGFLLCGLATGAAYLVRPEGLMLAVGPGAVALWLGLTRRWPRDQALARLTALAVGVVLVAGPYAVVIRGLTNKPNPKQLLNPGPTRHPFYRGEESSSRAAARPALFAAWWNDEAQAGKSRELWAAKSVFKEASKSANYVLWPLAGFAVLALRRRFASEPGLWVPAVLAVSYAAVLVGWAYLAGYISERHTVLLTLLACVFAAGGLPQFAAAVGQLLPAAERLGVRVTAASLLVALVASSLPFSLKPLHPNREGHKHAGRWLAAHVTDKDGIVDPFCWAEWYAGRTLYRTSWNPDGWTKMYVVWESGPTPHSRLPNYPVAKDYKEMPGARCVYHWPEDAPAEKARVQVWEVQPAIANKK